jgi:organic radical activating enzyme
VQCPFCKSPRWTEPRKTKRELEEEIKNLQAKIKELERTPGRAISIGEN